jgi:NADP-dependent 3-hydroxy acid dehydrogenase YdfG
MSIQRIALVTGYTGESGKALVKELVTNNLFKKVILVGRRQVDYADKEYQEKTV